MARHLLTDTALDALGRLAANGLRIDAFLLLYTPDRDRKTYSVPASVFQPDATSQEFFASAFVPELIHRLQAVAVCIATPSWRMTMVNGRATRDEYVELLTITHDDVAERCLVPITRPKLGDVEVVRTSPPQTERPVDAIRRALHR